jgi:hypothetical protein
VSWIVKKLNILPLHSQYILSLLLFVVKNIEEFISYTEIHSINTRHRSDLYPQSIKRTKYQKGDYYSGIKIFSHFTSKYKELILECKNLKLALKRFLLMGSFYTLINILIGFLGLILIVLHKYYTNFVWIFIPKTFYS